MTGAVPGRSWGSAWVDIHANVDEVDDDVRRGLKDAADDLEGDPSLKRLGKDMGDTVGESMGDTLHNFGPKLAKRVEDGLGKEKIKVKSEFEADNDSVERGVHRVTESVRDAFDRAGRPGGPLSSIGRGIADAIGAGFNISGRSPLIVALVFVFALIAELIVGAVVALEGLSALLFLIPSLIGAIILQGGVLFLVFQGLGEVIGKAFAAKDAEELEKALEGLNQQTRDFVISLLPLKDFFSDLKEIATSRFFTAFGDSITVAMAALDPILRFGVGDIAQSLGTLLGMIVRFFGSPEFIAFLNVLIPSTVKWIASFGPALLRFLTGLAELGVTLTPFLDWFGQGFNQTLSDLGGWLYRLSHDEDFIAWLEEMKLVLSDVGKLLGAAILLIGTLFNTLRKAGGREVLQAITEQLQILAYVLSTEIGERGLRALLQLVIFLSGALIGLVIAILFVAAAFHAFFEWLIETAFPWIADFFTNTIPESITALGRAIVKFFSDLVNAPLGFVYQAAQAFAMLPWLILGAIGDLTWLLFEAGRQVVYGLIQGLFYMIPSLRGALSYIANIVRAFWPFSPAKTGPLSGEGDPMIAGQKIVQRLAAGMAMEAPVLSSATESAITNINFGPGSVRVGFEGVVPTTAQAQATGAAAGQGILGQLAARDTRLAVRTL